MPESQTEYWSRRAEEHAVLAQRTSHHAASIAHDTISRAYRRKAEERRIGG